MADARRRSLHAGLAACVGDRTFIGGTTGVSAFVPAEYVFLPLSTDFFCVGFGEVPYDALRSSADEGT